MDSRDIQRVGEKPEDLKIFPYASPGNLLMDAVKEGPGGKEGYKLALICYQGTLLLFVSLEQFEITIRWFSLAISISSDN